MIWHQTEFRLVSNQLEKSNHNPNFVCINKILNRYLCRKVFTILHLCRIVGAIEWIRFALTGEDEEGAPSSTFNPTELPLQSQKKTFFKFQKNSE